MPSTYPVIVPTSPAIDSPAGDRDRAGLRGSVSGAYHVAGVDDTSRMWCFRSM
jgi:hypothetical protein